MRTSSLDALSASQPVRAALQRFLRDARIEAGDRMGRVILFGSVARGSAGPDSDVDLLVEWRGSAWDGLSFLSRVAASILVETNIEIAAHAVPSEQWDELAAFRTTFYEEIAREGVLVAA